MKGHMLFRDRAQKKEYLPMNSFLKTDAAETEVLTGLSGRNAAAKQLYDWDAKENMITHNTEALVSLKMETPIPSLSVRADVERYIAEFYR